MLYNERMEIRIEFFSQQIKHLREEHDLTQEELAHQLGISRQSIIAFERGRCLPSLPLAMSMADLFDLVLEDILRPTRQLSSESEIQLAVSPIEIYEQENNWQTQIKLPENIDEDKIGAELKDGILTITLPKKAKSEPKVTKIKVKKG